ncbi:MAG: glutamate--tRNA ligase family protein, partial [Desulfurococcaceae archaeon]
HRSLDPSNHLEEFDKMIEGAYSEGEAVVRVKTDLEHPDPSVRDWVALRIIDTSRNPHPLVGDKYVVWPTYNYAAGVDDYLMGVTHIFRGKEHMTNTVKQKYMYDRLEWKYPEAIHFGRLSLEGVVLSKSLMRRRVREGYEVYDDIRFGTLSALRRRGIVPEAIHEVIREVGLSPLDAKISYANLAAINRKIIDPIAYRYMYVEDPVEVVVEGIPEEHSVKIARHPTLKTYDEVVFKGPRLSIYLAKSDAETLVQKGMIRLMELANVKFVKHVSNGRAVINAMYIDNSLETAQKNDLQIVQWVPVSDCITVEVLKPFGDSIVRSFGYAERSIERVKSGDIIQFYRYGFVRVERTSAGIRAIFAHM